MEPVGAPEPADVLNGWKEIAAHLGKSARSVQRWERDLGLPVRRIPTPEGGSIVYALRSEVDAWRAQQGELVANGVGTSPAQAGHTGTDTLDDAPKRSVADVTSPGSVPGVVQWWRAPVPAWVAAVASLGAAVGTIATGELLHSAGAGATPAAVEVEGREFRAYSDGGRLLWVHAFDQVASRPPSYTPRGSPIVDVDLDGENEVVGAVRFAAPRDTSVASDTVFAFESDGTVLWSIQPDLTFTQGSFARNAGIPG